MSKIIKTLSGTVYILHNDNTVSRKGNPIAGWEGTTLKLDYPNEKMPVKGMRWLLRNSDDQPIITSLITHIITVPNWV